MMNPNRMIALFQRKADEALKNYVIIRSQIAAMTTPVNGDLAAAQTEHTKRLALLDYKSTKHAVELQVWQKAADLLRKEELNK